MAESEGDSTGKRRGCDGDVAGTWRGRGGDVAEGRWAGGGLSDVAGGEEVAALALRAGM